MRIGGFMPLSLSDFPGRVAVVVFTQGCNFCCPYCHNPQLIPEYAKPEKMLDEAAVLARLDHLGGKITGVVVSGGEPTLQPDLADFLARCHSRGFQTKLDTNGSRPEMLRLLLEECLLDSVVMDIKAPMCKYPELTRTAVDTQNIEQSIRVVAMSGVEHHFRTTVDEALLSGEDLEQIRVLIPAGSLFKTQAARRPPALSEEAGRAEVSQSK